MGEDVFGLLGRTIDEKVRVDECIGEGGFATVYRGFHLAFEQPVAIKCLKIPPHFDPEARASFLSKFHEEGKMLFRLSQHASIVRVFDLGDVQGSRGEAIPYLVLEWLDGVDLETLSKRRAGEGVGPWKEAEVLKLLRPAVDAIALAHRLGIAHRDLKPSNLVLANTVQGEMLKVLDFGIAKAMQDGEKTAQRTTRTSSGFHAFSPQYGAPEQFRSKRFGATGPWTDVHAMGLIMTELVVGRPAMIGEEHGDFYEQAMDEVRPTPRTCGTDVSDAFEALCRRCLVRDPAKRIQDADGVLAAMDAVEMGVRDLMDQGAPRKGSKASSPAFPTPSEVADTAMAPEPAPIPAVPSLVPGQLSVSERPSVPEPPSVFSPPQAFEIPVLPPKRRWPWIAGAILSVAAVAAAVLFLWYLPNRAQVAKERLVGVMAEVPGGDSRMGANGGAPDQRPEHDVKVDAFTLDVNEVTVEAFQLCVEAGACQPTDTVHLTGASEAQAETWNTFCNWGKPDRERHPINCVDWNQAQAYCAWGGKRLPTEREWEFAARGGSENRIHPWGDAKPLAGQFNGCGVECAKMAITHGWKWKPLHDEEDGFSSTAPVGSFPGSKGRWGHQDLAGNVWEWTASPFCSYGADGPEDCSKINIAARGGGWASRYPGIFRATFRTKYPKEYRSHDVGFRCAR